VGCAMNGAALVDLGEFARLIREHQARAQPLSTIALPTPRQVVMAVAAVSEVDAIEAWAAACSIWQLEAEVGDASHETVDKYAQAARRFIDHAAIDGYDTVNGAALAAEDWLFSAVVASGKVSDPSIATLHFRRSVLRSFYVTARALGLTTARPLQDLVLPPREGGSTNRAVDDGEMRLLKETADTMRGQRGPVTVALARCGAGTGEMGVIAPGAVDLNEWFIDLPGTRWLMPRRVRIATRWDYEVLAEQLASLDPTAAFLLPNRGKKEGIQSRMSATLTNLMTDARLNERAQVVPNSVRAWSGVRVYEATGDLFTTAAFLGLTSLDKTAALIGLDWLTTTTFNQGGSASQGPGLAS